MYDYAYSHDLCDRNYADHVRINTPDDDEKGAPFTEDELLTIWKYADGNEILQAILIMIYSGFRISAYCKMEVNFDSQYFRGGVKTQASKNRIVPFNREIIPFIRMDNPLFTLPPTGSGRNLMNLFPQSQYPAIPLMTAGILSHGSAISTMLTHYQKKCSWATPWGTTLQT